MADQVSVRPYRDEDLEKVLDLMRLALGETPLLRRTPALFGWKHLDNPFGRSIMLVAEVGGEVVGFRAMMRWNLVAPNGGTVKCVRPVDTATHPDHQRKGIFRRLTFEALEIASSEGTQLVFNTPNRHSAPGYSSMGWSEAGPIGVLVRLSARMLQRRNRDQPIRSPADLVENARLPKDLAPSRRPIRGLTTPRDGAYLNWRFASHPTARYSVVGNGDSRAVIRPNLRRGHRELVISDIFGSQPRLAARAVRMSGRPDYLVASFQRGTPERAALIRTGLLPVPGLRALTLYVRPLAAFPFDVTSLSSWDLALSDLELL